MTVIFSAGAREVFASPPKPVKRRAAHCVELLTARPWMYPVRRRGVMRGYRYFVAARIIFYCSVSSSEVRPSAIRRSIGERAVRAPSP